MQPGRGARRRRASTSARAPSRAPCCCASRGCRPAPWRSRGPWRCSARAPTWPTVAALTELAERRRRRGHRGPGPRRHPAAATTPLGFVHPLVRDAVYRELPPGERELAARRAPPRCCATRGAPGRARRRAAPAHRPPRRAVGRRARCATRAARRAAPRRRRRARWPTCSARSTSRRRRAHAPVILLELGLAEGADQRPGGGRAPARRPTTALDDPGARALAANVLARLLTLVSGAPRPARFARRARRGPAGRAATSARLLEARGAVIAQFGVGSRTSCGALDRYRDAPAGDLRGPGDAHARRARGVGVDARRRARRRPVAELALAALADGAADRRRQRAAVDGAARSPCRSSTIRDDARRAWDDALADAHRRGSVFSIISRPPLARLHAACAAASCAEAEAELRAGRATSSTAGAQREAPQTVPSGAFLALTLVGARRPGRRPRGARRSAARPRRRRATTRRCSGAHARARAAARPRAAARRRSRRATALAARFTALRRTPRSCPWRVAAGAGAGAARPPRRGRRRWPGRGRAAAATCGAPSAPRPRRCACSARCSATTACPMLEEAVARRRGRPARLEHARALAALGAALRRGAPRRPTPASRCGARWSWPTPAAPTALREHVRAELARHRRPARAPRR